MANLPGRQSEQSSSQQSHAAGQHTQQLYLAGGAVQLRRLPLVLGRRFSEVAAYHYRVRDLDAQGISTILPM